MAKYRVETDKGVFEVETDESNNPESSEFERGPNYPPHDVMAGGPSIDVAMAVDAAPKLAMAAPGMIRAVPDLARGIAEGVGGAATDFGGTIAKLGSKAGDALTGAKNWLTNNTPRYFGYNQAAGATPEARAFAHGAIDFANEAHPEIGNLVSDAAKSPMQMPSGAPALPEPEGLLTSQDAANLPPRPDVGEAPLDGPAPDVSPFQTAIRQGVLSSPEEMFNAAETQRKAVGDALSQTLSKYDASGSYYDPTAVNKQIKSLLERDATGEVMTTGWQGKVNEAIKDAASSLSDFSRGGPIKWSDAARVKTGLQGDSNYLVAGFEKADAAYKQVATLLKDDIDKQAAEMLAKQGGDVQKYQTLRESYGKLASLSDALNVASKRNFANSPIPWWVKMAGGSVLAGKAMGVVKGITGH